MGWSKKGDRPPRTRVASQLQRLKLQNAGVLKSEPVISGWVREEAPDDGIACGDVVKRIPQLTASTDFDTLDDQAAVALFSEVMKVLEAPSASAFGDRAVSPP